MKIGVTQTHSSQRRHKSALRSRRVARAKNKSVHEVKWPTVRPALNSKAMAIAYLQGRAREYKRDYSRGGE